MTRAEAYVKHHQQELSSSTQATLWKASAITSYVNGDEQGFLHAIDQAAELVETLPLTLETLSTQLDRVEVLQVRALGYTYLWQPEKAFAIYEVTDTLRPLRSSRDLASYHIVKAQTYCAAGEVKIGVEHARTGITLAERFNSLRIVTRVQQLCERLRTTPHYTRAMKELYGEALTSLERMKNTRKEEQTQ